MVVKKDSDMNEIKDINKGILRSHMDIELDHIILELEKGRTKYFRHFIDSYMCYRLGFVTLNKGKVSREKWIDFYRVGFFSKSAYEEVRKNKKNKIKKEHLVPMFYLEKLLIHKYEEINGSKDKKQNSMKNEIAKTIHQNYIIVILHKDEARDIDIKYNKTMPEEYLNGMNPWIRIKKVDEDLVEKIEWFFPNNESDNTYLFSKYRDEGSKENLNNYKKGSCCKLLELRAE